VLMEIHAKQPAISIVSTSVLYGKPFNLPWKTVKRDKT
jgi:hypothetical protein